MRGALPTVGEHETRQPAVAGVLAEFAGPGELLAAARAVREDGYTSTEAYTPFPVEGLPEALTPRKSPLGWYVLAGGLVGGTAIYALEYWVSVVAYPLNVGGRPLHSWPSFIPPTFEGAVLGASLVAVLAVFWLSGLPQLHHTVFEVARFRRASTDAFFLWIEAKDGKFRQPDVTERMNALGATEVWEVRSDE